jgi:uncharacterized membrane protein YjdF
VLEFLEWLASTIAEAEGDAFLGHQGDIWVAGALIVVAAFTVPPRIHIVIAAWGQVAFL